MAIVDWVKHTLPMKLKDGKRHLFPTLASLVYRDDGKTPLTDEQGLLHADKADDSDKLGGKAPEYYLQPRNLLDNSDFTNPVNQRGKKNTVSKAGYFIDRWTMYSAEGATYTIVDDGLKIDTTSLSSAGTISQYIPKLKDGNYTVATYDASGNVLGVRRYTVANGRCTLQGTELSGPWIVLWYSSSSDINVFELRCEAGNTVTYAKAALYEGSYTADTLPPYVPKGYTAELAECRNFYKIVNAAVKPVFGDGTSTRAYAIEHGEMRATLNASSISIMSAIERIGWNDTGAAFSVASVFPNNNTVLLYANGNVAAGSECWAMIELACSADL